MPEGPEVEKLRRQLEFCWRNAAFTRIESVWDPLKSGKYWQYATMLRTEFEAKIRDRAIKHVVRYGKWICLYDDTKTGVIFAFHLGGTGWFLPGPGENFPSCSFPHENFLHKVNEKAKRLVFHMQSMDPGFKIYSLAWNFYDGRTWAKFVIPGLDKACPESPWKDYGPDWIKDPAWALTQLLSHEERGKQTVKGVLCDPHVTAGLGNYLSCEACFVARVRPNKQWKSLTHLEKKLLGHACRVVVDEAMANDNHDHWKVFTRAGEHCYSCSELIQYEKDPGGTRGSYFCANCQS